MKSILEIYRIGRGPSSSHTMGPQKAAELFRAENPTAERVRVTLRGSLAMTGRGHQTDRAVREAFDPIDCQVVFDTADGAGLPMWAATPTGRTRSISIRPTRATSIRASTTSSRPPRAATRPRCAARPATAPTASSAVSVTKTARKPSSAR